MNLEMVEYFLVFRCFLMGRRALSLDLVISDDLHGVQKFLALSLAVLGTSACVSWLVNLSTSIGL
jgi:hypothetical protein